MECVCASCQLRVQPCMQLHARLPHACRGVLWCIRCAGGGRLQAPWSCNASTSKVSDNTRARARAHARTHRFEQAEADCNRALSFDLSTADRVKALLRRGTARQHLYRVPEAAEDFRAVLRLEPNNRQAREELRVSVLGGGQGAVAWAHGRMGSMHGRMGSKVRAPRMRASNMRACGRALRMRVQGREADNSLPPCGAMWLHARRRSSSKRRRCFSRPAVAAAARAAPRAAAF